MHRGGAKFCAAYFWAGRCLPPRIFALAIDSCDFSRTMSRIIGIDLGTTNSCAAYVQPDGVVKIVPYKGGDYTIPSIFAIDDKGQELVGYEAKRQWLLNPTRTVYGAKRLVGRGFSSDVVDRMRQYFSYPIEASATHANLEIPIAGKRFSLEEVQAKILGKIKQVAEAHLGETVTQAVVTVPAYFSDRQRQATKEAGRLANLDVVRVLNEPTAAALAYGLGVGQQSKGVNKRIAVYDLGGGTFDISVIEVRERIFEVKATGGDIFLGGIDFDNLLIDLVLDDFKRQSGVDLRSDPIAMQRIKDLAERGKIDLSQRDEFKFFIPFISMTPEGKPLDVNITVKRADFEALALPLVERTLQTCQRVLVDAGTTVEGIDDVILVGGQTRMPVIQKRIEEFFVRQPSKSVHPDEAVAVGAAIFGASLGNDSQDRVMLLDVIPMQIGIERADGKLHQLFARNASVPNAKEFDFTTSADNQATLKMRIYQGDDATAAQNEQLGDFTFSGLRPGKAGDVNVKVVFSLSQDGILSLEAKDRDTGTEMRQTVKVNTREA